MKAKLRSYLLLFVFLFFGHSAVADLGSSPFDYYPVFRPSFQTDQIKYAKNPATFVSSTNYQNAPKVRDLPVAQSARPARPLSPKTTEDSIQKINLNAVPLWGTSDRARAWTQISLVQIRKYWNELNKSRDVNKFCPRYSSAGKSAQEACWLLIFSALAEKESDFNQGKAFPEGDGNYSIGLFALSPGECRNAPGFNDLKNGVENLRCGIRKFAELTSRFGMISNGRKGASAYWSTLRPPYRAQGYNLGKLYQITPKTQSRFAKAMLEESRVQRTASDAGQNGVN